MVSDDSEWSLWKACEDTGRVNHSETEWGGIMSQGEVKRVTPQVKSWPTHTIKHYRLSVEEGITWTAKSTLMLAINLWGQRRGGWYPGLCSDVLDGCQLGTGGKHIYPIQQHIYLYMYIYSVFCVKKKPSEDIVNVIGKWMSVKDFMYLWWRRYWTGHYLEKKQENYKETWILE